LSKPVYWHGANKILKAPKGTTEEQVQDLHVFNNGVVSVSCWSLSEEALKEIINTGCIFVSVYSGQTQPPIFIGSHDEVREVAVDYGPVWKLNV
jgi:hypothetical protein